GASRTKAGTVNAAIISYYQVTAFTSLAVGTRKSRRAIIWMKALRGLIDYCRSTGLITQDPLSGVQLAKMKKSRGFHTWTEDEIGQYQKRHSPGTKARLALELLLQTGHARADVVRMGRQYLKSGKLSMSRKKTGVAFDIPLLPELAAELALHPA